MNDSVEIPEFESATEVRLLRRKQSRKAWARANREKVAEIRKRYRKKNKEKLSISSKLYREAHKGDMKAYKRKYQITYWEANRDKYNLKHREMSAKQRASLDKKYIKQLISHKTKLRMSDIPNELVEQKRAYILLMRELRE